MGILKPKDKEMIFRCVDKLNEATAFKQLKEYRHHYNTSTYDHSIGVAYFSLWLARMLHIKCDEESLVYGALLHDYYLYDCHANSRSFHLVKHPTISVENAKRDWKINKVQEDMIKRHMFPLTLMPPRYKESIIVNIVDKGCACYEFMSRQPYYKNILFGYTG
ncbi:MAG: HD domain-containing protein [Cellulosilyticum sp.]|nr:HD domain-containing protein [Cellulosilyticum sp.]MEE1072263.1 HD domain-containing protein [Cellulosilyticum sp.]